MRVRLLVFFTVAVAVLSLAPRAAAQQEKIGVCHQLGNEHYVFLVLPPGGAAAHEEHAGDVVPSTFEACNLLNP